jgi:hypothetical protein
MAQLIWRFPLSFQDEFLARVHQTLACRANIQRRFATMMPKAYELFRGNSQDAHPISPDPDNDRT